MELTVQGLRLDGARWVFSYRSAGRARRMTIGKFPAVTAKDASKAAQHFAGLVAIGRCPSTERKASRRREVADAAPIKDRVEKVAALYLKHQRARVRDATYNETARVFSVEVVPAWRGKRLGEITKGDVRQLVDKIAKRGAPVGANRCLTILKAWLTWCVGEDLLPVSPAASVRAPSPESPRERVLSDAELGAVWQASLALGQYGKIVQLLALTGQRRSEVAELSWSEIDLPGRTWTLPALRAKNGRQHSVPLSAEAIAIFESLVIGIGPTPVFEPQSHSRMKSVLDKLLPAMPAWCLHDLRRTAASGMAGLGTAPHVVEAVLNHRSGVIRGVASVYIRASASPLPPHLRARRGTKLGDRRASPRRPNSRGRGLCR
jgi:integrase